MPSLTEREIDDLLDRDNEATPAAGFLVWLVYVAALTSPCWVPVAYALWEVSRR
jgi:hypothetical protein